MKINFFEEYPTEENLSKLDMVDWPATVFVAAGSLAEFEAIEKKYASRYPLVHFGWWPTIPGSYWVSGFANPKNLQKLFSELTSKKHEKEISVLIDLELPLKISLYLKNIFNLGKNKRVIAKFFNEASQYNIKLYTAEYPVTNNFLYWIWKGCGISPSFSFPHTKLPMVYTSMGRKSFREDVVQKVKKYERHFAQAHPHRIGYGLGTIATGVLGNEPILFPEKLAEDLVWAHNSGVDEVFIFRLGGMNAYYLSAIKGFL